MTRQRNEARVAEARRLHGLGLSTRAIAAQLHVDPTTVQRWTDDVARPRGPRPRPDVRDSLILRLKGEGLSFEEIARRVHMSKTGARMRYYSLTGRQRPDRPETINTETEETS
jgi:transposase